MLMLEQDLEADACHVLPSDCFIFSRLNERIVHITQAHTDIPESRIGSTNSCYLESSS
jgi:hypothetical protein